MGVPVCQAEVVANPGGTGTTLAWTLPSHQEDDILIVQGGWSGNQAPQTLSGWNLWFSQATGTASTGCGQGWWWRRVAPAETVSNPTLTIGATAVTRIGIAYCIRGADIDNPANTWWLKNQAVGNSTAPAPAGITTLAPNYLLLHGITCRGNSAITHPTGYSEEQDAASGTTLAVNGSTKTQATAATVSGQAATISSNRWVAAIIAIPSPDYPYFRAQTNTLATATLVTGTLPTGTTNTDFYGRKDLIIATVEAAGGSAITVAPSTPADWTEIGTWNGNTSGDGTKVKKYWALYDGSINLQFTRSTSGEIAVCLTTYRNPHQTAPIGNVNAKGNASSTSSSWDSQTRGATKSTVTATCIADGTPSYTTPAGWTERADGNGIGIADQIFEAGGTTDSAAFTLSTASPTAVGLVEVLSHAGTASGTTHERSAAITATGAVESTGQSFSVFTASVAISTSAIVESSAVFFSVLESSVAVNANASVVVSGQRDLLRSMSVSAAAVVTISGTRVVERSTVINATTSIESSGEAFTLLEASVSLSATANVSVSAVSFSVIEATAIVSVTSTVTVVGVREVSRSVLCSATGTVEASGQFFTVFERASSIETTVGITVAGTFFSVLERQTALSTTATIATSGQSQQSRQVAVSTTASIAVSGVVIPPGATEHERSASVGAIGNIATAAQFFSVLTRAADLSTTATITATGLVIRLRLVMVEAAGAISVFHRRVLQRSAQVAATGAIAVSGVGAENVTERSVSLNATGLITTNSVTHHPTPPQRSFMVESGQRITVVREDLRLYKSSNEKRGQLV